MYAFHTLARRQGKRPARPARIVFQSQAIAGVTLIVRLEAVVFFLALALALELLIMPWALDTHPLITAHGAHGKLLTERVTRHAGAMARYAGTLAIVAITMAATLIHELGHALALRRARATEITITIYGAGGVCRAQARDTSPLALLWYAAAGPLATILVVLGLMVVRMGLPWPHDVRAILWLCAAIQAGTLALNLVPILRGSDGGHILRALATLFPADRRTRPVGGAGLCGITAALVGTLQGNAPAALLCGAVTVFLAALTARLAWVADRGAPIQARPRGAEGAITFW